MRQKSRFIALVSLLAIAASAFVFHEKPRRDSDLPTIQAEMADAAASFVQLLSSEQRESAIYTFDAEERMNFNFVPMPGQRKGLRLKDMTSEQRASVHNLLQSALSAQGYLKATSIQQLERILSILENRPDYRDPENYFVTIFGAPSASSPWGWRFEGHHISLNFASVDQEIAVTPAFLGSNPGQVKEGPFVGWRVLSSEINAARDLMATLSDEQRKVAIIADTAPREIITGNQRTAVVERFEGLRYSDMNDTQQALLRSLVQVYLENMKPDLAQSQAARVAVAGWEELYFAWAGGLNEGEAHYYRIHGPTILIEYDNTQSNANHAHSVWRDLTNDFGRDLLQEHYRDSGADHGH